MAKARLVQPKQDTTSQLKTGCHVHDQVGGKVGLIIHCTKSEARAAQVRACANEACL